MHHLIFTVLTLTGFRGVLNYRSTTKKVVWLAIQSASQKWTMPLRDWRMAMSRFIIEFCDCLDGHF
ncbi:hypothetical protein D1374_24845 [Escherichia coli]|nr:hypothetical protein [Escherichia coli]EFE7330973.1 hypothetical protein [Escherichia coli]EFH5780420.1 hypothetical protein [Escherichia coli]EFN9946623.1 hypothetical protein [Escherichia coli]EGD5183707.1 hypothetical protein [Escherichia coli]